MPLRERFPYCINHSNVRLLRNEGLNALSAFSDAPGLGVDFSRGVPVTVYSCPECGYVEMYAAHVDSLPLSARGLDWRRVDRKASHSVLSGLQFQDTVLQALMRGAWPFVNAAILPNVRLPEDADSVVDAVVILGERTYVAEIKPVTSLRLVHDAVYVAIERTDAYSRSVASGGRHAMPMVIVPAAARFERAPHGVPILRFDQDDEQFLPPIPDDVLLAMRSAG